MRRALHGEDSALTPLTGYDVPPSARIVSPAPATWYQSTLSDAGTRFAGFTVFTILIWSADAFSVAVSARALDLQLPFSVAALLLCGLGLGSAVPSTPGYVGIFQFVTESVLMQL